MQLITASPFYHAKSKSGLLALMTSAFNEHNEKLELSSLNPRHRKIFFGFPFRLINDKEQGAVSSDGIAPGKENQRKSSKEKGTVG
jgi:hypothetical protein